MMLILAFTVLVSHPQTDSCYWTQGTDVFLKRSQHRRCWELFSPGSDADDQTLVLSISSQLKSDLKLKYDALTAKLKVSYMYLKDLC